MILAKLSDAAKYAAVHAGLAAGFDFLRRPDIAELEDGRHEIDGDRLFAIVARGNARGMAESPLEFHRRYLDIQYVVSGVDQIGWMPTADCLQPRGPYEADSDLGFYLDQPCVWLPVAAESLAILFPEDAHAPLGGSGDIHKVVVKVAVDW
jgi:biofilm protein TabA